MCFPPRGSRHQISTCCGASPLLFSPPLINSLAIQKAQWLLQSINRISLLQFNFFQRLSSAIWIKFQIFYKALCGLALTCSLNFNRLQSPPSLNSYSPIFVYLKPTNASSSPFLQCCSLWLEYSFPKIFTWLSRLHSDLKNKNKNKKASSRSDSHAIQFTHLKCTSHCFSSIFTESSNFFHCWLHSNFKSNVIPPDKKPSSSNHLIRKVHSVSTDNPITLCYCV